MCESILTIHKPLLRHLLRLSILNNEQKWSKGKMREKVANKVLFDEETYNNRLMTEIPKVSP